MYLKRLEIIGFKSFADKTVIDFERGLTAVVGPNGSGKSNITEAVRWVMGETSAKSLRGGKMDDVIFAGTQARKQVNVAEVTLILDNSDNFLPLDFAEISITRRQTRGQGSDYFINKQAARRQDVQDLFMDSGLGKESFSIISQGKVEQIFNSKPEERRAIFEEAAGVLKYKIRKRKAEQKLFETQDSLDRLQDILYEIEDQLDPLERQSNKASRFLELRDELTKIDVSLSVHDIHLKKELFEEAKAKIEELQTQIDTKLEELDSIEEALVEKRAERRDIDEALDSITIEVVNLTELYKETEGRKNVLLERSSNTQKTLDEYVKGVETAEIEIKEIDQEIRDLEAQLAAKKAEIVAAEELVSEARAELERYSKSQDELLADLRSEYIELLTKQTNANNELGNLNQEHERQSAKNANFVARFNELEKTIATTVEKFDEDDAAYKKELTEIDAKQAEYTKLNQALEIKKSDFTETQRAMFAKISQENSLKAKVTSIENIIENNSSFYQGVKEVLAKDFPGVIGVVAKLIDVNSKYAQAIETALGASSQNIVTDDEDTAKQAIKYLKENRLGRATFLPSDVIRARNINEKITAVGFVGVASEIIKYDDKIAHVIQNLLGNVLVAEDMDAAVSLARTTHHKYRIVTLDGEVIAVGGAMTGGATKRNQGGYFELQADLEKAQKDLANITIEASRLNDKVAKIDEEIKAEQASVNELRDNIDAMRFLSQDAKNRVETLEKELARLNREKTILELDSKEIFEFLENYEESKTSLEALLETVNAKLTAINEEVARVQDSTQDNEARREEAVVKLNEASARLAQINEQTTSITTLIEEKANRLAASERQKNNYEYQIKALNDGVELTGVDGDKLAEDLEKIDATLQAANLKLENFKENREKVQTAIATGDDKLAELNREIQELSTSLTKFEGQYSRSEAQLDNLLDYLSEEYDLSYEAALAKYDATLNYDEARTQVRGLKGAITALGHVNIEAIEQYRETRERYDMLTEQKADLEGAKTSLLETMEEMDAIVSERFLEMFNSISMHFTRVFPQMFGGGSARLVLVDPEDLLNTGVEIEAQPPGKKLQSLGLLSGGERALTALALLFSILHARPVPFCILDEVEAALDEANVNRYGEYLNKFEGNTQFIVVTHRKGTMSAAIALYGVTMAEAGVSSVVSVRLEDVKDDGEFKA
ncbi:MAG: chromosome segregation protein SMC [Lactobacillales bacterium]|jgi:chromosome segregation protein|nr:chromosome segregation protein SMC [Lactobacillales bacterium]